MIPEDKGAGAESEVVQRRGWPERGCNPPGPFCLTWLTDHRAEFQLLLRERLGVAAAAQVLWSAPRLICVAESFTRYDVHAVREIQRNIDLVRYRCFGREPLALETVVCVTSPAKELPS
ncbi:hypothetical protein [Streptomyces triculaminicus]|uniref:hypothetical protein n=1 Tax=Streptomyces triculaminicus TaxID=2816232 RepID=UPI0037888F5B